VSDLVLDARELAATHLQVPGLEKRWAHVQAVAARAEQLGPAVDADERPALTAAAWLHDVGYAFDLVKTGFHPLDGALRLAELGWPARIVGLVAHHSGARYEAAERGGGLLGAIEAWPLEDSPLMDALITADLTTGPDGSPLTYEQRVAEIRDRYAPDHVVHRTWLRIGDRLNVHIERVAQRMAAAGQPM
jgi:hypothetical protein